MILKIEKASMKNRRKELGLDWNEHGICYTREISYGKLVADELQAYHKLITEEQYQQETAPKVVEVKEETEAEATEVPVTPAKKKPAPKKRAEKPKTTTK